MRFPKFPSILHVRDRFLLTSKGHWFSYRGVKGKLPDVCYHDITVVFVLAGQYH